MKKMKIKNKIITSLILSSNILYGNVLLIDLNFGSNEDIRTYKNSFPTSYSSINIKESKAIYTKDFSTAFSNITNAGNINFGNNYIYSNWSDFSTWANSKPDIFTDNPTFVILEKDIQNVSNSVSTYNLKSTSYNTVINYNYCEFTRYESGNLLVNKLKVLNNPTLYATLNNNIEVFTPEMIIRYKNINHEEGKSFLKSHLNIKTFIDFYKADLNDNEIRRNFSKLISSVDFSQWEYRDVISSSRTKVLNLNTTIENVITNLNKIKENISQRDYMIEVLGIVKNLNLTYYNDLHSNGDLFYGNQVCIKSNENNNAILTDINSISIPMRTGLVSFMNKYNAEKIVFNYRKEVLQHKLNVLRDEDFTLVNNNWGWWWIWNGWWWNSTYNSDLEKKKILTFIDKKNINFSTEGSFVSKILTPNNEVINIVAKNYSKGNLLKMDLDLNPQETTNITKSPSELAEEKAEEEAIVNQDMNEQAQAATDTANADVSDFKKMCIDIINLKFSKSYDAVSPAEEEDENQPTDDEWSWNTALNEYIVDTENDRREEVVSEEEEKIDTANDLIDDYSDSLENSISNKNTQENIINSSSSTEEEIEAANLALNGDDDNLGIYDEISSLENSISIEEDKISTAEDVISENQPLTEEEEQDFIMDNVESEYVGFDSSERSTVESCVYQPGSCPVD